MALAVVLSCSLTLEAKDQPQEGLTKEQTKALNKEVKAIVKQKKKENWQMVGSSTTLDYALQKHLQYIMEDPDHVELTGTAVAKNPKIGRANAIQSALAEYAARAQAQIVGNAQSEASGNTTDDMLVESDIFTQHYATAVNQKINGIVSVSFVLCKEQKDGNGSVYEAFLTYDEKQAKRARAEAAAEAMKQSGRDTLSKQLQEAIEKPVE